ncbi:MAG: hypothetical protein E7181_01145 [Erysipelotrichaceae bacterium]|nr:hypothetical protein [Erysipelotrichaceae bacterium]
MKTLYARHKWMQIVFGGLFLAAGIAIIIISLNFPDNIAKALSVILAITLFLFGASCIFSGVFSLKSKYFDPAFIYGDLAIALGVLLCIHNTMIQDLLVVFVGTLLTTIGVVFLGEAVAMIFFKRPKPSIVIFFLLGAAFLTFGVLSYVYQNEATQVIYIATGALMALVGFIQIIFGIVATIKAKKIANDIAEQSEPIVLDNEPENPQPIDAKPDDNNNGSNADA